MSDPADGIAGVTGALLAGAAPAQAPEQFDLLEHRPASVRLASEDDVAQEVIRTGKAGRPKGARNLATRELKDWLLTLLGKTPQEWRIRWLMLEPEELARRLGCKVAEAFDRQERIAADLGKYFMAPMVPVDQDGNPLPFIQMNVGGHVVGGGGEGDKPWLRAFRPIEGELVQDVTPEPVHD